METIEVDTAIAQNYEFVVSKCRQWKLYENEKTCKADEKSISKLDFNICVNEHLKQNC